MNKTEIKELTDKLILNLEMFFNSHIRKSLKKYCNDIYMGTKSTEDEARNAQELLDMENDLTKLKSFLLGLYKMTD